MGLWRDASILTTRQQKQRAAILQTTSAHPASPSGQEERATMKSRAFVLALLFSFGAFFVLLTTACAPYPSINTSDDFAKVTNAQDAAGCVHFVGKGNPPASNLEVEYFGKYGKDVTLKECMTDMPRVMRSLGVVNPRWGINE